MKVVYLVFLLLLLGALTVFVVQNSDLVQVKFFNITFQTRLAFLAAGQYVLGMLTGWTVLGVVRKSINRTLAQPAADRRAT